MDYQLQTSAKSAVKILHGTRAIINVVNAMNPESEKTGFDTILADFQSEGTDALRNQQRLSRGIWESGTAPTITNTPYYSGVSEIILHNRAAEISYLNNVFDCLKNTLIANDSNTLETGRQQLREQIHTALNSLDQMRLSSQMRDKLFEQFQEEFKSIDPDNQVLHEIFAEGLQDHNQQTLKETLSKFMITPETPAADIDQSPNSDVDGPSI